jgi:hypothetical protein
MAIAIFAGFTHDHANGTCRSSFKLLMRCKKKDFEKIEKA